MTDELIHSLNAKDAEIAQLRADVQAKNRAALALSAERDAGEADEMATPSHALDALKKNNVEIWNDCPDDEDAVVVTFGCIRRLLATPSAPERDAGEAAGEREIAFISFALRCSADNPASIGNTRNYAINLLERFGIEPRETGTFYNSIEWDERATRALIASRSAPERDAGMVLVPREPTEAMLIAAEREESEWRFMPYPHNRYRAHWAAMLAARPVDAHCPTTRYDAPFLAAVKEPRT